MESLRGSLPKIGIDPNVDAEAIGAAILAKFPLLEISDFVEDALWRDIYALTSTFRTLFGGDTILTAWSKLCNKYRPHRFKITSDEISIEHLPAGGPAGSWVQVPFTFATAAKPARSCSGTLYLVPGLNSSWKIWCLVTLLEDVEGFGDVDHLDPEIAAPDFEPLSRASSNVSLPSLSSTVPSRMSSTVSLRDLISTLPSSTVSLRSLISTRPSSTVSLQSLSLAPLKQFQTDTDHFDCIIVGAGQAGLNVAGRLKALGASSVILERNAEIGQNWSGRYSSLHLHTPVFWSSLAFEHIYPKDAPYFVDGAAVARGLQHWAERYAIDVRTSSNINSTKWDEEKNEWTVMFTQNGGPTQTIRTPHLVFAIGNGCQVPKYPPIANSTEFAGETVHSVNYRSAASWKGKRGVVIGAANTGHDIARDMVDAGLSSVTMVQRNPTVVIQMDPKINMFTKTHGPGRPVEPADRKYFGAPTVIRRLIMLRATSMIRTDKAEYFNALESRGFRTNPKADVWQCLYERMGGHHVDVGAGEYVAKGMISVKSGSNIMSFTKRGLQFDDGTELDADVVVFATGFQNDMRTRVAGIVGDGIAHGLSEFYGIDEEGELRGAWKSTGRESPLSQSRSLLRHHYVHVLTCFQQIPLCSTLVGTSGTRDSTPASWH